MKGQTNAIIFGIAIIISSIFISKAYVDRAKTNGKIQVTGLGKADFTSDLIVWEASFSVQNYDLKTAYSKLETDKKQINKYLINKGIKRNQIVFSSVITDRLTKRKYTNDGKYIGEEFIGYRLRQNLNVESKEVNKVEKIAREVTELLNKGITLYSQDPRYYYTKLADLKIEMISKATKDARLRAEKIAEYSGGKLGNLQSAKMGIFQITGQNSNEDYSWGGTFNTSSKEKTASITMKLVYLAQ